MHWQKLTLLTITMAVATLGAPQNQQIPAAQQQQASASSPVAQSRDAPVYPDTSYAGGFSSGGNAGAQYAAPSASYGAPQAAYGAPAQQQQQGGYAQPSGNNGYYYYYYPVQESKADFHPQNKDGAYTATDSYGIDPLGIIAVLAIAGLVIAGLALLFPGWAYVKSDEHVYYRSNDGAPSVLGMSKEDYRTLTSLVLTAIEGDDACIDKMMCDAGKLVKKIKKADTFLRLMEDYAPSSVAGNIKKLRMAMKKPEDCKNVTCGKKKVL